MSAQRMSDLNLVAIQEFRKLVEGDQALSETWKNAVLTLTHGGEVPPSLAELDAMLKKGK